MKRLFITITLVLSSFFFISSNVKANKVVEDYSLVTSDLFESVYNHTINRMNTLGVTKYLIYYDINSSTYYSVLFNTKDTDSVYYAVYNTFRIKIKQNDKINVFKYSDLGSPTIVLSGGSNHYFTYTNVYMLASNFSYQLQYSKTVDPINLIAPNYSNVLNTNTSSNNIPMLLDIYNEYGNYEPPDIHVEEKEVLSNFYNICIEKLDYLGEAIVSNYIYLTIIGVFLVIFLFELIFRRRL